MLTFSSLPLYYKKLIMGKFIGTVYKHSQQNCPYPSPNTTIFLPVGYLLSSQCDSKNDCGATLIAHKQSSHVSNLTTTKQVDIDRKNDDNTHSFATPRKHNNSNPEISKTTTTTITTITTTTTTTTTT